MEQSEDHDEVEINKEYANIIIKLQDKKEGLAKDLDDTLNLLRKKSDLLFPQIRKPSTLRLDARYLNESTYLSNINFKKSIENTESNYEAFNELLVTDNLENYLDMAKKNFYGVNFYSTLALETPIVRNQTRQNKIDKVDTEPDEPKKIHENKEIDINIEIPNKIKQILKEHGEVEYYRLVINIDSFTKTIENIFYLAFAIKQKMCSLELKDNMLVVVNEYKENVANNHIVIELKISEYYSIIKKLELKETMIK